MVENRKENVMRRSFVMVAIMTMMAFVTKVDAKDWKTNFKKASEEAAKSKKYMLLDFTGSDWCGWCIRLKKEVFSKRTFKKYAKENLICVELDFPRGKRLPKKLKKQNAELAKKYNVNGFPTVLILSPDGKVVVNTGYRQGGAKKYVAYLKKVIEDHKNK